MLSDRIVVCAVNDNAVERAKQIAKDLALPFKEDWQEHSLILMVDSQSSFLRGAKLSVMDWHIDFLSAAYIERRSKRTRKKDPLSRALGLHKNPSSRVLDMSAGLGKDAHWIAYCGATVTLLERNPVLALLLQEAVDALRQDPDESAIGKRMAVIKTDAEAFLESLTSGTFDVAYYDPMFLPRQKSALVKKDMQIMHLLLGEEPSSDILLKVLDKIPKLVVKRAKADPIYSQTPHVNILAGLVRYEIYMSFDKTKFVVQS